jgi:hypothetical protein
MVTAVAADEFKRVGVAAFHTALHQAGRLAPQDRHPAVAGLTGRRHCRRILAVNAAPRAAGRGLGAVRAVGDGAQTVSWQTTGHDVRVPGTRPTPVVAGSRRLDGRREPRIGGFQRCLKHAD